MSMSQNMSSVHSERKIPELAAIRLEGLRPADQGHAILPILIPTEDPETTAVNISLAFVMMALAKNPDLAFGSYLSIFELFVPESVLNDSFISDLKDLKYKVKTCDSTQFLDFALSEYGVEVDLKTVVMPTRPEQIVGFAICAVLLGKAPTEHNYVNWLEEKSRAFSAELEIVPGFWNATSFPSRKMCVLLHQKLRTYPTRRDLFLVVRALGRKDEGELSKVCLRAIQMLRWADMTHFALIDRYITQKYPVLLSWGPLRARAANIHAAYEFMADIPKEDAPFVKLLSRHCFCFPVHRSNLFAFTAVAERLAVIDDPTRKSYFKAPTDPLINAIVEKAIAVLGLNSQHASVFRPIGNDVSRPAESSSALSKEGDNGQT